MAPRLILISVALVLSSCQGSPTPEGQWPPKDFALDIRHELVEKERRQVLQRVQIWADGLVVYREADASLRLDGVSLPIYRRLCVYRMQWRSIRQLSRELNRAPVTKVQQPANPPPGETSHHIAFRLKMMENKMQILLIDRVVGLMHPVLAMINRRLPKGHPLAMPGAEVEEEESPLQDVPEVKDSPLGSFDYHRRWLVREPQNPEVLAATFALAVDCKKWSTAELCVRTLEGLAAEQDLATMCAKILTQARD